MSRSVDAETLSDAEENEDFLDLLRRLPKDRRRILDVLLRKIATLEETEGETAALSLIEDVSSILATTPTAH